MSKVFLIGEIGINHNGNINLAKKLILLAKEIGFDAVKFQKRTPELTTPKNKANIFRETPWGYISYLDYKKKIEFNRKDYDEINRFCKKIGILWFASAWDKKSLFFLNKYNLKFNKIPSALITKLDYLKIVARQKKYTFIATGACELKDIKKAVNIFKKENCKFSLMHCVSTYPAKEKDLNLSFIKVLKKTFNVDVGYSGHEQSVTPSLMSACLGATSIERHITIDRTLWGTDQSASLSPEGMRALVKIIRKFSICYGEGKKIFLPEEKLKIADLRYW